MKFIKIKCLGCLNSFRQPDFHTYHKTLSLPPKTTVAGMIGSALGISPIEVNDEWLKKGRFQVGIIGKANGKANDLWQIRKYETKTIASFKKWREDTTNKVEKVDSPYKTAVIVREILYQMQFSIYLHLADENDMNYVFEKLQNPSWALSLGREDELIKITQLKIVELEAKEDVFYRNTVLPFDINQTRYEADNSYFKNNLGKNLLEEAPKVIKLPLTFSHKEEAREADSFGFFTFISDLPLQPKQNKTGFWDTEDSIAFQIF